MNIFLLAIAPSVVIAGLACVVMSQRALLAVNHVPLWAALVCAFVCGGVIAVVAAVGTGQADLWGVSAPVYSLVEPLRPAFLTVLLLGLAANTVTDLRERSVLAPLFVVPVVVAVLIALASIPFDHQGNLLHASLGLIIVTTGMIVCGGITYLISLGGRVMAHFHGADPDYALVEAMEEQSDLRWSDFAIPFAAVSLTALASGIAWASGNPLSLAAPIAIALVAIPYVREPRRLSDAAWWPRAEDGTQMPKQEEAAETGQDAPDAEAFGTGDVWLMVLVGALLGPIYGLAAMFIGMVLNGLLTALPVIIYDIITARKEDRHTPMVPWLAVGTLIVIFYAGLR
jgi:prepilin signal peptidase PulO-like enzyme (type II secretory pathway)